ncbi:MAG: hypothetical protein IJB27_06445 [Clostridia bacterium]|nr:hypothetical protein [Clostridia bacterium]
MDQKPTYSVDDILLEYELKKRTETAPAEPAKRQAPKEKPVTPISAKERFAAPNAEKPTAPKTAEFPAQKKQEPTVVPPIEEDDVKIAVPRSKPSDEAETVKVFPAPKRDKLSDTKPLSPIRKVEPRAEKKTVAISTRTRVLTVDQTEDKFDTQELPLGQLEGQMVMENFTTAPIDEEKLEEELRRRRQEKIEGFRIVEGGKTALKLTGEEEDSGEQEDILPEQEEEDELEDFTDYAEADAIRSELTYRCRTSAFALIATGVIEALLAALTLLYALGWLRDFSPAVVLSLHMVLLIGMLGVNHRMTASGLKNLFSFKADADTPSAIAGLVGIAHTVLQFGAMDKVTTGGAILLSAVAGLGVFAGALGRQMRLIRVRRNFAFVGNEKLKKNAAFFVEDEKSASEIGRPANADGVPPIVYYRKASFLNDYLKASYAHDPADKAMRWFVPLVLGVSLLCAVGYGLLFPMHAWETPTVFAASALTALPVWTLYVSQRTVSRGCKRSLKKGVLVGGWDAIDAFGRRPRAVVIDAGELFPKEQVKLHGIKTFSGTRIDEAITDAAAVVIEAGGPLAPIFNRLIENRTDILREVDSLAYEQDMGLSGWVGGRRVLIGNRRLLENHGVEVPPKEYEARYITDGRNVVYLSTGGELSAMFVVSYLANAAIRSQLRVLQKASVDLVVRTCDPNITAPLVATVMNLPEDAVQVLSAGEGRAYERMVKQEQNEPTRAALASGGKAFSKLFALVQCRRMRRGVWVGLLLQMAISVAAMGFAAFVTATTGTILHPLTLLLAIGASGVITRLIVRCTRA